MAVHGDRNLGQDYEVAERSRSPRGELLGEESGPAHYVLLLFYSIHEYECVPPHLESLLELGQAPALSKVYVEVLSLL